MKYKEARVKFSYTGKDGCHHNRYYAYFIPESEKTTLFISDYDPTIKKINQSLEEINIKGFLYPDLIDDPKLVFDCQITENKFDKNISSMLTELFKTKEKAKTALEKYQQLKDKFELLEQTVTKAILA